MTPVSMKEHSLVDCAALGEMPGRKVSHCVAEEAALALLTCFATPTALPATARQLCRSTPALLTSNHHVGDKSLSKSNLEGWEVWLNGRVFAWHMQGPSFFPELRERVGYEGEEPGTRLLP